MYKVYCDNYLIHDDSLEYLRVITPKLSDELNKVASFKFTIYPDHPHFDKLQKMKSIVTVYQDNYMIFRGRILNDVNGFYNEKQVTCESELAFLLDSVQRPYEFQGSPAELFTMLINNHNKQVDADHQFKVGRITVTDPNNYISRSDSLYKTTWDNIKEKLLKTNEGYLWVRHEEDGNYIDYLEDFNVLASQKVEYSKNLLSLKRTIKADDIYTVIIPVGASIQDEDGNDVGKLTIKSVNGGKDYLENAEGIEKYGRIVKMVEWKDVTVASNLKSKGQKALDEADLLTNSIELTAADLGSLNKNVNPFRLGTKIQIVSKPHNFDSIMLVKKLSLDLTNPANNKLSLGTTFTSMTEQQITQSQNTNEIVNNIESQKTDIIQTVTKQTQSTIEQTSESIMSTVEKNYYLKNDTDELIQTLSTSITQMSDGWDLLFKELNIDVDDLSTNTSEGFENIEKYIRFIDGKIFVGVVENELEVQISNEKISFYQGESEIAYFSNNQLHFENGSVNIQYTDTGDAKLQLGKFAFIPRSSGNLSFKKVVM